MPPELKKEQYSKAEVEEFLRKEKEDVDEKLEVAKLVAEMTDAEKTLYKSLEGDEKNEFLFASAEERAAAVQKVTDSDPVLYTATDGTEVRKSHGPMALKLAKDNDATNKQMDGLRKEADDSRLTKLAETDYEHLAGDVPTRVATIKAVEAIEDETQRKAALDALKAQNAKMADALKNRGTTESGVVLEKGGAEVELETLAKAHQKDHPEIGFYDAYDIVSKANPALYNKAVNGE